jgi:hypothetical protein
VTYDQGIQYYKIPLDVNAEPSILWVNDLDDPFVPLPRETVMLNLTDDRDRIEMFLDKLITFYYTESRKNMPIQTCLGAAMSSCSQLLEGSGGHVLVFSSNGCSKGVGSLKTRDKVLVHNTPEELQLFQHTSEHKFYEELGQKSCAHSVTFDLYLGLSVNLESIDLASLNKVVQLTGGDILFFNQFNAA